MLSIDFHAILVAPMKRMQRLRNEASLLGPAEACEKCRRQGVQNILDNEYSDTRKDMDPMEYKLEFVPPGNISEAAIKNPTYRCVATLSRTNTAFSVSL